MVKVKCKHCGQERPYYIKSCPHCGVDYTMGVVSIVVVVLLLVIFFVIFARLGFFN